MSMVHTPLTNRGFITITGNERRQFIQGLITQDIELLDSQKLIYSCFLTPNGKFLYDFFIFEDSDSLVIDCEGGERAADLYKKLSFYKLRSKVTLELKDTIPVWQIWGDDTLNKNLKSVYADPRHESCGYRCYDATSLNELNVVDFSIWDKHRISNAIPDGSRDIIPEKSFIHESEIVTKTAVSYTKGCYMGQELVSRMHHRGLSKKILKCVDMNALPDDCEVRSSCGDIGLALVKI